MPIDVAKARTQVKQCRDFMDKIVNANHYDPARMAYPAADLARDSISKLDAALAALGEIDEVDVGTLLSMLREKLGGAEVAIRLPASGNVSAGGGR